MNWKWSVGHWVIGSLGHEVIGSWVIRSSGHGSPFSDFDRIGSRVRHIDLVSTLPHIIAFFRNVLRNFWVT